VDFLSLVKTMVRQWRSVVAILLLTMVTVVGLISRHSPSYEADSALLVLAPASSGDTAINPYAELTKPLATTASALALAVNGPEANERIQKAGGTADYLVVADSESPILSIQVANAPDPTSALRTLDLVAIDLSGELTRWQTKAEVPVEQQFRVEPLTRDSKAQAQNGSRDRLIVGVLFLGVLAAGGVALVADSRSRTPPVLRVVEPSSSTFSAEVRGVSEDARADYEFFTPPVIAPPYNPPAAKPAGRSPAGVRSD
jgi:hypothetical protein